MTHWAIRTHWSKLRDPVANVEVVSLGDARGNTHALVDNLAETLVEVEVVKLIDARGETHALVNTLADTLAEVKAGSGTRGDA